MLAKHVQRSAFLAAPHRRLRTDHVCAAIAVCLLLAGLVSSVPAKRIQQFAVFSAITLVFGGIIIMILLPLCAPKLQPATWVFSSFFAWEKEEQGIPTDA